MLFEILSETVNEGIKVVDPFIKLLENLLNKDLDKLVDISISSVILRLILVVLFSGIIGMERATKRHEAGLRTYILVSLGSAIAIMTNQFIFETFATGDVGRIAGQVVSGIGFLGAGTILVTSRSQIKGLTTAAGLWASACMGLAIGVGFYTLAIITFILVIFVLIIFPPIENHFAKYSKIYRLHVELQSRADLKLLVSFSRDNFLKIQSIERNPAYENSGLSVYTISVIKLKNKDKKKDDFDLIDVLSKLPYVNFVEEIY